jgi:hypothetical protein
MSFDTTAGTRGARQPSGFALRAVNRLMASRIRRKERAEAWQQISASAPRFAGYQQKTDRELPIIRLVPRSGGEAPQDRSPVSLPEASRHGAARRDHGRSIR